MSWVFQPSDPMGGAPGEAYANTLTSTGMLPAHVLAREAIQNSVDAGDGKKVRVCFRHATVTASRKDAFIAAAALDAIGARREQLQLASPNCLESLDRPRTPLSLLYVEDHGCVGLDGDPHDRASNFHRLLLSLGDRTKARTAKGSGGSYGYGKAVYSSSSAIRTIFAYTRFLQSDGSEQTRAFGCGYYASHDFSGRSFSGRAWRGKRQQLPAGAPAIVDPLEGRAADELAERLGFETRAAGDLGTTILIVDATVDIPQIVAGVEEWWWPRLVANRLDVEVVDALGQVSVPRPRKNEELRPFIQAFDLARKVAAPKAGTEKVNTLNRLKDLPLGDCGLVVAPLDDRGEPVVRPERRNTVALIRSPLMVVAYQSVSSSQPVVVGTFVSSDEVDPILKKSEPPAHDRWDADSTNLRDASGEGREAVTAVLSRIKAGFRRFQQDAAPPAPPKQRRLSLLERALGTYFRPQGSGPHPPPPPTQSWLHMEFTKQPMPEPTDAGTLRLRGAFVLALDGKASDESVDLKLDLRCPVLEDDGEEGDELDLKIQVDGVVARTDPDDPHLLRFPLERGKKAHVIFESAEYDPSWTVRVRPEVDREVSA